MDKREFMQGVPDYNKKFFSDQFKLEESMRVYENKVPMKVFLPEFRLKSANELVGVNRWIVDQYKKYSVRRLALSGIKEVKPLESRRLVEFKRLWGPRCRALDDDNIRDGFKYLRDGLKHYGWIYDDNPTWIDTIYTDRKPLDHESWGVVIIVKETDNG